MRILLITICSLFFSLSVGAQTFTEELRKQKEGQGKVTIKQSAEIERLVNTVPEEKKQDAKTPQSGEKRNDKQEKKSSDTTVRQKPHDAARQTVRNTPPAPLAANIAAGKVGSVADTSVIGGQNKKIIRNGQKVTGYRIQIYSGGNRKADREKCEQIKARLKNAFPELPVYVHFYSPSWKCRAGNFTDYNEAKAMLKEIKAVGFTHACLVKGTVIIQKDSE